MDIEHLTKSQIILLTLLVSFMTSIATGIVTVSLLQQAPPPVTQTINRVVERTVERVIETKKDKTGNTVTNEKTVVVKETDLISAAVKSALPSVVAIYKLPTPSAETPVSEATTPSPETQTAAPVNPEPIFVGRGVFIDGKTIVTDAALLEEGVLYSITLVTSGATAAVASIEKKNAVALLFVEENIGKSIKSEDLTKMQLGETLVELAGESRVRVSTGIISDIERTADGAVRTISISGAEGAAGSPITSLNGLLIGINTKSGVVLAGTW